MVGRVEPCDSTLTPDTWFIVFSRNTTMKLARAVAFGEFKHVMAFGYAGLSDSFIFYDVGWAVTRISIIPKPLADAAIEKATTDARVVCVPAQDPLRRSSLPALFCVPAVAHLVGLRSCALRPDAFLRDCLRIGQEVFVDDIRRRL